LQEKASPGKPVPGSNFAETAMIAILTIAIFLGVVAALNIWEFGRLD
jgi:hypothetical protein